MLEARNDNLTPMRTSLHPAFSHCLIQTSHGNIALLDSNPNLKSDHPTIIFIHGHCTNKEFFNKQLSSSLFLNYRLIALDLPGYGESEPPKDPQKIYSFPGFASVVTEVIQTMKLNNIVIVGEI